MFKKAFLLVVFLLSAILPNDAGKPLKYGKRWFFSPSANYMHYLADYPEVDVDFGNVMQPFGGATLSGVKDPDAEKSKAEDVIVHFTDTSKPQGLQVTLPPHDNWGDQPTLKLEYIATSTVPYIVNIAYTNIYGKNVRAQKGGAHSTLGNNWRQDKNTTVLFFSLEDIDDTQPVALNFQKAEGAGKGELVFPKTVGYVHEDTTYYDSPTIYLTLSTSENDQKNLVDIRKAAIREMHAEFVAGRENIDAYREALEDLGAALVKLYRGDRRYSHHEVNEYGQPLNIYDQPTERKKTKAFDYQNSACVNVANIFVNLKPEDINLSWFMGMLGFQADKASAEVLFTRLAIWCLSDHLEKCINCHRKGKKAQWPWKQKCGAASDQVPCKLKCRVIVSFCPSIDAKYSPAKIIQKILKNQPSKQPALSEEEEARREAIHKKASEKMRAYRERVWNLQGAGYMIPPISLMETHQEEMAALKELAENGGQLSEGEEKEVSDHADDRWESPPDLDVF